MIREAVDETTSPDVRGIAGAYENVWREISLSYELLEAYWAYNLSLKTLRVLSQTSSAA